MTTEPRSQLWAVVTPLDARGNPDGIRQMALLGSFETYDEALAAWHLADDRRRAGRSTIGITVEVGRGRYTASHQRLDYLAVRSADDEDWNTRYRRIQPGRWTALLAGEGRTVRVRIFGNDYRGTVVRCRKLTAEVRFNTRDRTYVKTFPILPASAFDRGVHA